MGAAEPLPGLREVRSSLERSLVPGARSDLDACGDLPIYRIHASYQPGTQVLLGTESIEYRNRSGAPLTDLGLCTYASAPCYHGARLVVQRIEINGQPTLNRQATSEQAGLVVSLRDPLAPGSVAELSIDFRLELSSTGGYHGLGSGVPGQAVLYAWYPQVAQRRDGAWLLHGLAELCDPTMTEMSQVLVDLTVPEGMQVISGGTPIGNRLRHPGQRTFTIASAFTRDLAVVIAEHLGHGERQVGDLTIASWWTTANEHAGRVTLDLSVDCMAFYAARFGPYPYATITAIEVPLGQDVGGMESTSLVLLDSGISAMLANDPGTGVSLQTFLHTMVVAHELAHQWWYGLVGSDAWTTPWLDESLTNWASYYYLEQRQGPLMGGDGWRFCLAECLSSKTALRLPESRTVGDYHGSIEDYEMVVYARGALMYQSLRHALGEQRFLAFLRDWCATHRYGSVDAQDWRAAVSQALGAPAAQVFFSKWMDAMGLKQEDLVQASQTGVTPARAAGPSP